VHDDPSVPACIVNRAASYGLGRALGKSEADWMKGLQAGFAAGGYKFPDLMRRIALSDALYRVKPPEVGALPADKAKFASDANRQERGQP
jgi:hypothetical protein